MHKGGCWIFLSDSSHDIEKVRIVRNEFERLDATFICKLLYFLQCPLDELITYEESRSAN